MEPKEIDAAVAAAAAAETTTTTTTTTTTACSLPPLYSVPPGCPEQQAIDLLIALVYNSTKAALKIRELAEHMIDGNLEPIEEYLLRARADLDIGTSVNKHEKKVEANNGSSSNSSSGGRGRGSKEDEA